MADKKHIWDVPDEILLKIVKILVLQDHPDAGAHRSDNHAGSENDVSLDGNDDQEYHLIPKYHFELEGQKSPKGGLPGLAALAATCRHFYFKLNKELYKYDATFFNSIAMSWGATHNCIRTLEKSWKAEEKVQTIQSPRLMFSARPTCPLFAQKNGYDQFRDLIWERAKTPVALGTPLHFAAASGSARAVAWLLNHGANPRSLQSSHLTKCSINSHSEWYTPAHWAICCGFTEIALQLIRHDPAACQYRSSWYYERTRDSTLHLPVRIRDQVGFTLLHEAVKHCNLRLVDELLKIKQVGYGPQSFEATSDLNAEICNGRCVLGAAFEVYLRDWTEDAQEILLRLIEDERTDLSGDLDISPAHEALLLRRSTEISSLEPARAGALRTWSIAAFLILRGDCEWSYPDLECFFCSTEKYVFKGELHRIILEAIKRFWWSKEDVNQIEGIIHAILSTGQCHKGFMAKLISDYEELDAEQVFAIRIFLEIGKAEDCRGDAQEVMWKAIANFVEHPTTYGQLERFCELFRLLRKHDVSPYANPDGTVELDEKGRSPMHALMSIRLDIHYFGYQYYLPGLVRVVEILTERELVLGVKKHDDIAKKVRKEAQAWCEAAKKRVRRDLAMPLP